MHFCTFCEITSFNDFRDSAYQILNGFRASDGGSGSSSSSNGTPSNQTNSVKKERWCRLVVETNAYQQIGQSTENTVSIEMDLLQVGSEPVGMRCPYCQEDMMTRATYRNSSLTHIIALVLGILFWWLCCCIIPYVSKRWKNVEHYCPNCSKFLGVYSKRSII